MRALIVAALGAVGTGMLVRAARRAGGHERTRRLSARPVWRLPRRLRVPLARALADADVALEPEGACELWLAVAGGAALLAQALAGLGIPALLSVLAGGPAALHAARGRSLRRVRAALPDALERAAARLRGGGTVADAVAALAEAGGPLASDLRRIRARAALGLSLTDALAAWPAERDLPDVRAAAGALALAASVGGRAAEALEGLARSLRDRLGAVAEARALSTQGRLSAVVVGAAPLGYLALASLADRASVAALVGSPTGRGCLAAGLGLEAAAIAWIRRIVREEV